MMNDRAPVGTGVVVQTPTEPVKTPACDGWVQAESTKEVEMTVVEHAVTFE